MAKYSIEPCGEVFSVAASTGPVNIPESFYQKKLATNNPCSALHGSDTTPSFKANASDFHKLDCPCFSCTSAATSEQPTADVGVLQWLERDLAQKSSWESAVEEESEEERDDKTKRSADKTPYAKQQVKKSGGVSLLSQKLAAPKHSTRDSSAPLRRSLRFEIRPPRISQNSHKDGGLVARQNEFMPLPGLRNLCPPGHPIREGEADDSSEGSVAEGSETGVSSTQGSADAVASRRAMQKPLHIHSRVDCVAAAYKTEDTSLDIEDYVLWDELHQTASF